MSDLTSILADLAAGTIDAAEAERRIDALTANATPAAQNPDAAAAQEHPGGEPLADPRIDADDLDADDLDDSRPQYATHTRESFRAEEQPKRAEDQSGEAPGGQGQPDQAHSDKDEPVIEEEPEITSPRPTGSRGVDKVVIRGVGRRVRVIGDASVATVSATGPHVLRRTGRVLEVTSDGEVGPSFGSFSIVRPPRSVEDLRTLATGKELVIKVNPNIPVDVEVTAGSLTTQNVPVLGKVRVTAGGANLEGVIEVSDALVQAGSATVRGDISQGRSRVRVESGSLTIQLGEKSNVAVKADTQLGRVSWPGEQAGSIDEYVVGNGAARLDIGVVMGHASVRYAEGDADTK